MNSKFLLILVSIQVVFFLQVSHGKVTPFDNIEECTLADCDEHAENSYLDINGGSLSSMADPYCLTDDSGAQSCTVDFTFSIIPKMSVANLVILTTFCTDKDYKNVQNYPVAFQGPFDEGVPSNLTYSVPIMPSKDYDESKSGMRYWAIQTIFRSMDSDEVSKCITAVAVINQNDPKPQTIKK